MGEYIRLDGEPSKLGTCECLGYWRFEQYASCLTGGRLEHQPGNDEPIEYTKGGSRFRFPFPNEDSIAPGAFDGLDKGQNILVPKSLGLNIEDHRELCHHVHSPNGGGGFNLFYPCPASKDWKPGEFRTSVGPHAFETHDFLTIVQQRPLDGQLWTVVQCAYCGSTVRVPEEDAHKLTAWIRETPEAKAEAVNGQKLWREIADRIDAGYAFDNPVAELIALGWLPNPFQKEAKS